MEKEKILDAAAGAVIRDSVLTKDQKMEALEYLLDLKQFHEEIGFKISRCRKKEACRYAETI